MSERTPVHRENDEYHYASGPSPVPTGEVERMRADAGTRRSEKLSRIILDEMYQFVALLDLRGNVLQVNQPALRGAGLTHAQVVGKPFQDARWWQTSLEAKAELEHAIERAASGNFVRYEAQVYGASGGEAAVWLDFSIGPVEDAVGRVTFLLAEGRNITEKKRAEAEIEIERRKDDFIAAASHEMKTPLTSIRILAEVLKERVAPESDPSACIAKIEREIERLNRLTDNLLDISAIKRGGIAYRPAPIDLAAVADAALQSNASFAKRVRVHGMGPIGVIGDFERLTQAVSILLSNAIKYSPPTAPVILTLAAEGSHAVLRVIDEGIGIDAAFHEKIFTRFYRVTDQKERTYPGLGMGLYLASEIANMHGGRISVESVKGSGSIFSITLPVLAADRSEPIIH